MKNTFLACLLFFACAVSGQSSYWETLNPPDGGAPTSMVEHPNGWLFGKFYGNGVFRSKDDGLHWEQIFWPAEYWSNDFYDMNLGQGGALFKQRGSNNSVETFVSYDGGDSWAELPNSFGLNGVTQTRNGTLFGRINGGKLRKSMDGGMNWEEIMNNGYIHGITTLENGGVYFVDNDGIAVSPDEGITWQFFADSSLSGTLTARTYDKTYLFADNNKAFRVDSAGNRTEFPFQNIITWFVAPDSILINSYSGWRVSYDDGLTWQVSAGMPGAGGFPLHVTASNGAIFNHLGWPYSSGSLYRSLDGGIQWDFASNGIHQGWIIWLDAVNNDTIFVKTNSALWRSTNGSVSWTQLTENTKLVGQLQTGNFVLTPEGEIYTNQDYQLLYSDDYGQNFVPRSLPDPLFAYPFVAFDTLSQLLFTNTEKGLVRSSDKGITWEPSLDSLYATSMAFHPSGKIFAYFRYKTQVAFKLYESSDSGQTWILNPNAPLASPCELFATRSGDIIISSSPVLYKSTDVGITWQTKPIGISYSDRFWQNFAHNSLGHYYFCDFKIDDPSNFLSVSIDGGNSKFSLPKTMDSELYIVHNDALDFDNRDERLYVAWFYGTSPRFSRSARSTLSGAYLTGTVFKDADGDCSTQDPESPLHNWVVRADGNDTWHANTDSSGRYTMFIDTGAYFLTTKPILGILWETCGDSLPVQLPELFDTLTQDIPILSLADCPYMTVDVVVPTLERCFDSRVYLQYCNLGTQPADSVWVDVALDPHLVFTDTLLVYEALGNNTYRFQLGSMSSGGCGTLSFSVYTDCDSTVLGQTLCVEAHIYPDSVCIPIPGWSGAEIQVSARCEQDSVIFEAENIGGAHSQPLQYYVIEDDVVLMQNTLDLQPAEQRTFTFPGDGRYLRFELEQEPGHPFSVHTAAWEESCGGLNPTSLGFVNQYFVDNGIPAQDVECREITGSFDPNDKQGFPLGFGENHLIEPNTEIQYLIRFQNTGTAPAHHVTVRDTLSILLDPTTLRMGPSSHPYTWSLDGQGFLRVYFANINLPDSNSNEAASHGFFSFNIAPRKEAPLGSGIFNTASIYFDFNSPVRTNETHHRLGIDFLELVSTDSPDSKKVWAGVSPNPVGESVVLTFAGLEEKCHRFLLTDINGRELRSAHFQHSKLPFQRGPLNSGIYFYRIMDMEGRVALSGKIILK